MFPLQLLSKSAMWRDAPSRDNFSHLEWPYSNINLGPKIWRSFLRISSRCWKKRRRRTHTSFKLANYSNQTWQSAVFLFTKATRKAACEQAPKWRGVKIKKNSPSETTRAWPEKKRRRACRLSLDVAHSPSCNYPPRRVGRGGGGVSKEICGTVRVPVWRHVSRQWLFKMASTVFI